jgi:uncharacterized protein (TIGR03437 family)
VTAGQVFSGAAPTVNPVNLLIDGVGVTPSFVGLSSAGLFQINLTIPPGLGTGDLSLVLGVGGVRTPAGAVISLQVSKPWQAAEKPFFDKERRRKRLLHN